MVSDFLQSVHLGRVVSTRVVSVWLVSVQNVGE